jgi:hypothetical protein
MPGRNLAPGNLFWSFLDRFGRVLWIFLFHGFVRVRAREKTR